MTLGWGSTKKMEFLKNSTQLPPPIINVKSLRKKKKQKKKTGAITVPSEFITATVWG